MKAEEPKVAPRENPLVPFALMKRMYAGMVETRLLEAYQAKRRAEGKRSPVEGQEACRAAVVISLEGNDLVLDSAGAASSRWLRGEELGLTVSGRSGSLLPALRDASQQVGSALGAAAALKRAKLPSVVAIFLEAATKRTALRSMLSVAAREELPLLCVAFTLPDGKSVAADATRLGVPGIPVEAHDPVAICRVAQESILRARAGGGPALLECVCMESGKRATDPIRDMAKTLLRVGACDRTWLDAVGPQFERRLRVLRHERSV